MILKKRHFFTFFYIIICCIIELKNSITWWERKEHIWKQAFIARYLCLVFVKWSLSKFIQRLNSLFTSLTNLIQLKLSTAATQIFSLIDLSHWFYTERLYIFQFFLDLRKCLAAQCHTMSYNTFHYAQTEGFYLLNELPLFSFWSFLQHTTEPPAGDKKFCNKETG